MTFLGSLTFGLGLFEGAGLDFLSVFLAMLFNNQADQLGKEVVKTADESTGDQTDADDYQGQFDYLLSGWPDDFF